jgi:hypothetical protein
MYKLQQWTCADMRNALDMMGFNDMVKQNISYIYPFYSETKTMQVVLYGAGKVGQDYYKQLRFRKDVHITLWVDKDYEKYDVYGVRPISEIIECKYDYIVISVRNVIKVTEIRQDLTKMGIPAEKILWKEPETLVV